MFNLFNKNFQNNNQPNNYIPPQNASSTHNNLSFADNNTNNAYMSAYPYGQFPHEYTKSGQEALKERQARKGIQANNYDNFNGNQNSYNASVGKFNQSIYPNQTMYQNPMNNQPANNPYNNPYSNNQNNYNAQQNYSYGQSNQYPPYNTPPLQNYNYQDNQFNQNAFMQNNNPNPNNNSGGGLDINSLLPLLTGGMGGKGGNNDMLKTLLPLLSNKGGINQNDLINLISKGGLGGPGKKQSVASQSTDEVEINQRNIDDFKRI